MLTKELMFCKTLVPIMSILNMLSIGIFLVELGVNRLEEQCPILKWMLCQS